MTHDVFLSYSSVDKPVADAACAALEAHDLRCWYAPRDILPGSDWSDAIIDAISECRVFVLVLSGASNASEQVKREVQNAVGEAKPIIPFRIENIPLSKHMRYFIGTPHWLDALAPPLDDHLFTLADTIGSLIRSLDNLEPDRPEPDKPDQASAAAPPKPAASAPSVEAPTFSWDSDRLAAVETDLSALIGPLAGVLVREAAARAHTYDALYEMLAKEVPKEADRQRFLARWVSTPTTPATSTAPASTPPAPSFALDDEAIRQAEQILARYIGPLSRVLVKQAARQAKEPAEFCKLLAAHIGAGERDEFLRKMSCR